MIGIVTHCQATLKGQVSFIAYRPGGLETKSPERRAESPAAVGAHAAYRLASFSGTSPTMHYGDKTAAENGHGGFKQKEEGCRPPYTKKWAEAQKGGAPRGPAHESALRERGALPSRSLPLQYSRRWRA